MRLLTLEQAAGILQISKKTLLRIIHQREVPAFKVGGQWRLREAQILKWVEDKESEAREHDGQLSPPARSIPSAD